MESTLRPSRPKGKKGLLGRVRAVGSCLSRHQAKRGAAEQLSSEGVTGFDGI